MGCRAKQKILKREISNGQEALKEMVKVLSHQGKANHNISERSEERRVGKEC